MFRYPTLYEKGSSIFSNGFSDGKYFLERLNRSAIEVTLSKQSAVKWGLGAIEITPFSTERHDLQISDLAPESGSVYYSCASFRTQNNVTQQRELLFQLEENYDAAKLTSVLSEVFAKYHTLNVDRAVFPLQDILKKQPEETEENLIKWITKIANLSFYKFDKYKEKKPESQKYLEIVVSDESYDSNKEKFENIIQNTMLISNSTKFARDIGNERADVVNPDFMEAVATTIYEKYVNSRKLTMEVISGKEELTSKGLNMIYAVGQGARFDPRLIILNYRGNDESEESIALVGKGITFDSGGLNLKPTGSIENMHLDMCGSAAVLGAFSIILEQQLKKNVIAVIGLAENAIDANAYKPHSILHSYNGLTVEVGNTDAEGRLVLADALGYVQENYNPGTVIDIATLTGACIVALGEHAAGLFSNTPSLSTDLQKSSENCFERVWPLPILPEHVSELKSAFADTRSTGKGRYGGSCTAAAFLQKFIKKDVKWAHIDAAGPCMLTEPRLYFPRGGTGFGVELLHDFVANN